jgi:hypothetical protein
MGHRRNMGATTGMYMPLWQLIYIIVFLARFKKQQVGYAFPQAPLEDPVYMHFSQGWYVSDDGDLLQHQDPTYHDHSHYIQLKKMVASKQLTAGSSTWLKSY